MRERLLIVDDEIGVVGLLKSFFEMSGYTVYTACNGKDALKQAGCQPDLVLLDINMPDSRLHRTGQRGAFACGEHIRVAVHRFFDELILAAAVIFLIPTLYFCGCFIRHTEIQAVFIFAHHSLQSAVRHACFR